MARGDGPDQTGTGLPSWLPNVNRMDRRERSYRGISARAALEYLEGLGGEQVADRTVEGDGWEASLSTDTVEIGPTLTLTEVTVRFDGRSEVLDGLVERFSQKAMRAGG